MEPVDRVARRRARRIGLLVAALAILCLVLALSSDPGSGTATNLQPAGDAAGLVVGAHHAKPLPTTGTAILGLVLLVAAAAALVGLSWVASHPGPVARRRHRDRPRVPRPLATWTARTWRAPPLVVA
jgi:hypothetical protein